ncbi:uncharacterized protein LOC125501950 isoform X1 [Athalia rosae]|uniref:uncharacterized protein LOC125501950 isoform X1 n=1 Tax=Athalia rosae TaxID=37344 RepID=UPI0020346E47|nr:uncharacterized protein LOC125501950 isoform X1 [Athalia rosae]XP_048515136.1 uncharacterized protein LOC125501950 isoform X1 [Athalia rosae]XP_048515137.1 uncharacterized protein LOC125501950 isoform X1 [Athalia rosae]XP_048515138.1 uncharacterized protein LOC125501950 isoform X1 [Athalia rosae]
MNEEMKKLIDKLQKSCEENRQMLRNIFGIVMMIYFRLDKVREDGSNENSNSKQINNESIRGCKDECEDETSKVEIKSENDAIEYTCDLQILENTPTADEPSIRGTKRRAQSTEEDSKTEDRYKKSKNDEHVGKGPKFVAVGIENPINNHDGSLVRGEESSTSSSDANRDRMWKMHEREWRIELGKRDDRKYNIVLKGLWGDASDRRRQARRILSEILGRTIELWEMRDNFGYKGQPYLIVKLRNQEETDKVMAKKEQMKTVNVVEVMHDLTRWQRRGRRTLRQLARMEGGGDKIVTVENDKVWATQWRKSQGDLQGEEMERKKREKRKGELELKTLLDKRIEEVQNLIGKLKEREDKLVNELEDREMVPKTTLGNQEQEKKKRRNDLNNNKQTFK